MFISSCGNEFCIGLSIFFSFSKCYITSTAPEFPKSSSKREYSRHDELASRSRVAAAAAEYGSRILTERRSSSYRDEFSSRGSSYSDIVPRSAPRAMERRPYADEVYGRKPEWPIPAYREARSRDYDPISGSKRSYSAMVSICFLSDAFNRLVYIGLS